MKATALLLLALLLGGCTGCTSLPSHDQLRATTSGAGIFNDRGQVVGVVSAMNDLYGCTFMLSYPLQRA